MAFDPKAYLAQRAAEKGGGGGFDPAAYLATRKGKAANDLPRLNPHTGMPLDTSPDEVTAGDMLSVDDIKPTLGMASAATFIPEDTLDRNLTPEQRRAKFGERAATAAGTVAGMGLGGALGGAGAAVAGPLGLGIRTGAAALTAAGSGAAAGATREAVQGGSGQDIANAAVTEGLESVPVGVGAHLTGEAGAKAADKLINAKNWVGRYLRADKAGTYDTPEMKALPKAEEGIHAAARQGHGRIAGRDAEMAAEETAAYQAALNPPGPKPGAPLSREQAILEAAPDRPEQNALLAAARGVDAPPVTPPTARESLLAAASQANGAPAPKAIPGGYEPAPSPAEPWPAEGLKRPVDREKMIGFLQAQQAKNIADDTGKPLDDALDAAFNRAITNLGPKGTTNTVGPTLGRRQAIGRQANFGSPSPSPEDRANQQIYGSYRQAVHEASSEIKAADERFSPYATKRDRRRDIIYNTEDAVGQPATLPAEAPANPTAGDELVGDTGQFQPAQPVIRPGKEKLGVRNLERYGDVKSKPGREAQPYLEELANQDPEFRAALDFIANKSAYEGTRFALSSHLPQHLTSATALGGKLSTFMQLSDAAKARLVYPGAQAAGGLKLAAPFSGSVSDQLLSARDKERERLRLRADLLGGNHQ